MTLNDLKEMVDKLVDDGLGDTEIKKWEPTHEQFFDYRFELEDYEPGTIQFRER